MLRLLLPLLAVLALSACVGGNGGAVVVRWRIVNQSTGSTYGSCDLTPAGGGDVDASIDSLVLHLSPVDGDAGTVAAEIACPSCRFGCDPPEHTTRYEIPGGTYRMSLEALRCGATVGSTPPALVRAVRPGEVTNLGALEVSIAPGTRTTPARLGAACAGDGG